MSMPLQSEMDKYQRLCAEYNFVSYTPQKKIFQNLKNYTLLHGPSHFFDKQFVMYITLECVEM